MFQLLHISLSGGLMILVIALLRVLLQRQVKPSVWLLLWSLVVLRLLLPFTIPSPTSVFNLFDGVSPAVSEREPVSVLIPTDDGLQSYVPQQPLVPAQQQETPEPTDWLFFGWLAGGFCIGAYFTFVHLQAKRSYRFSLPIPSHVPVPQGLRVRMLDELSAPVTYGLFRPIVLLPANSDWDNEERLRHILLHEEAHIRYHDILRKYILLATLCVHWFNPLVWLLLYLATQDMEMRCDAVSVQQLGAKRAYAETLIAAEEDRLMGLLQTGFSFSSTGARLKILVHCKHRPVLSVICSVVIAAILCGCFLTDGQAKEPQEKQLATMEQGASTATAMVPEVSLQEELTNDPVTESNDEAPGLEEGSSTIASETEALASEESSSIQVPTETEAHEETQPVTKAPQKETSQRQEQKYPFKLERGLPTSMTLGESIRISVVGVSDVVFITENGSVARLTGFSMDDFYDFSYLPASPRRVRCTVSVTASAVGTVNIYCTYEGKQYLLGTLQVISPVQVQPENVESASQVETMDYSDIFEMINQGNTPDFP